MQKVARCRVAGPLAAYEQGLRAEALRLGYTPYSAELQVWLANRLSRWMSSRHLAPGDLKVPRGSGSS